MRAQRQQALPVNSPFTPVLSGLLQRKCACGNHANGGECDECRKKTQPIQRASLSPHGKGAEGEEKVPRIVHEVLRSPGQPLDPGTRALFEPRFGHDFSQVRVHADAKAAKSARAVNALAYTVGRNVVFGPGQYLPGARAYWRVLTHELVHVLQQNAVKSEPSELAISQPTDTSEHIAEHIAGALTTLQTDKGNTDGTKADAQIYHRMGINDRVDPGYIPTPLVQREATGPRAATGTAVVADVTAQTATQGGSNVTAGSLSRREWESLFRRHFTEPDQIEDEVESSHARYFYSRIYGWIDAQHYFAHIQFAEEQGLEAATTRGLEIERKQALLRRMIGPEADDPTIYSDFLTHNLITPDDFLHYREDLFIAITLAMNTFLSDQERALIRGFDDRQLAKLILDNAMSAWSAEDLVSNQLGIQFFRLHGAFINTGTNTNEVRQRFIDQITQYFTDIEVINDARVIRRLARSLPGKERWTSAKRTEARARARFPELFDFTSRTHRIRIAVYDRRERAEQVREEVARTVPSAPGLHVAPYGRDRHALYTGALSHFEAILLKRAMDRAVRTGEGGALVERQP